MESKFQFLLRRLRITYWLFKARDLGFPQVLFPGLLELVVFGFVFLFFPDYIQPIVLIVLIGGFLLCTLLGVLFFFFQIQKDYRSNAITVLLTIAFVFFVLLGIEQTDIVLFFTIVSIVFALLIVILIVLLVINFWDTIRCFFITLFYRR